MAAAGDIACDPSGASFNDGDGDATRCHQKYTSDLLLGGDLAAVLALGDTQYEEATLEQFELSYDLSWGRVKSITRPAIGNHEYRVGPNGETPTEGYYDYFNGVGNAVGPAGDRDKGYYSFDVGEWHLIALNSMCDLVAGGCAAGSPQEQWLRADLAASADASCTLAYWHHPLFNSGPEGSYSDTPWDTTALWQALYDSGAELVLTGHSHAYERFAPQDAHGTADAAYGLREFIVGTGGKSLGSNGTIQPNSEVRDNTQYGVIRLVLHPNAYDWSFVSDTGMTRDTGSTNCHGDPPPDTSIASGPTGKIATTSASFAFASSETGSTFKCKLDGPGSTLGTETACDSPQAYSGLADGSYTFSVHAIDGGGNADATPATRSFTVDTVAPSTTISSASIKNDSATFSFTSSEAGSTFACKLDAGLWVSCTSPRTYGGLTAGQHTFAVYAIDAVGNADATPATRTVSIAKSAPDDTAPQTTIDSGPDAVTSESSASFSFSSSEAGSTFECRLDSGGWQACSSPKGYTEIATGSHKFEARATDAAGNTDASPAARSWSVEQQDAAPGEEPPPSDQPDILRSDAIRPSSYVVKSGQVVAGKAVRRLHHDDGRRLEIAAARKRSGRYVSSFEVLPNVGADVLASLDVLRLAYDGGSARRAKVRVRIFNHRAGRWVTAYGPRAGRRDRSFEWSASAFAADYVSANGKIRVRVKGKAARNFRTRTDLVGITVDY